MRRSVTVTLILALLGVAALAAIITLERRAENGRRAQLRLSVVKLDLASIQTAPYKASSQTGGSPALAGNLLRRGEQEIRDALARLHAGDPPRALLALDKPLQANIKTLNRIYQLGVSPAGYGAETDRLSPVASATQNAAVGFIDEAASAYGKRARRATDETTAAVAAALLMMLCSFGVVYRKNRRLLDASRREALIDALTGLQNRRALVRDLATGLARASDARPLLLGLFDLDGFKQYNDTFGHPAGDELLTRFGDQLRRSLKGTATVYRMGGDEFCLLAIAELGTSEALTQRTAALLAEIAETLEISCSYGVVVMPSEAQSVEAALRSADERMYRQKVSLPTGRRSGDAFVEAINEVSDAPDAQAA
jgi:diguanylate cyclase (GGDEF)-like protein